MPEAKTEELAQEYVISTYCLLSLFGLIKVKICEGIDTISNFDVYTNNFNKLIMHLYFLFLSCIFTFYGMRFFFKKIKKFILDFHTHFDFY